MTNPFALAVSLLVPAASPRIACILGAFRGARAEALRVLPTIPSLPEPGSTMTELVEGLVAHARASRALPAREVVMEAEDVALMTEQAAHAVPPHEVASSRLAERCQRSHAPRGIACLAHHVYAGQEA